MTARPQASTSRRILLQYVSRVATGGPGSGPGDTRPNHPHKRSGLQEGHPVVTLLQRREHPTPPVSHAMASTSCVSDRLCLPHPTIPDQNGSSYPSTRPAAASLSTSHVRSPSTGCTIPAGSRSPDRTRDKASALLSPETKNST